MSTMLDHPNRPTFAFKNFDQIMAMSEAESTVYFRDAQFYCEDSRVWHDAALRAFEAKEIARMAREREEHSQRSTAWAHVATVTGLLGLVVIVLDLIIRALGTAA